jgi:luciferase family oxidoreductase group 1
MKPLLSVLDPSPVFAGRSSAAALLETLALAEALDGSAYRAFWVQEHHNTASFAGTAPEILIASLAQRTRHLILGAGGVMLPNYSPLKVAEQFCTLEALSPGRIELGIGRATGADPRTSAALLGPGAQAFPTMMQLLIDWLLDASGESPLPAGHRAAGIRATDAGHRPRLWMLSSSAESAAYAGAIGVSLAFADFLSPGGAGKALDAYRQAFRPSPFAPFPHAAIGLVALAAETDADARQLGKPGLAWTLARAGGKFIPFPSQSEADELLSIGSGTYAAHKEERTIFGSGEDVAHKLIALSETVGADELFILTLCENLEDRIRSYRLIAEAMASAT